jgi:hypothetical protein
MRVLAERYGHPSQMPRVGLPDEIGSVIAESFEKHLDLIGRRALRGNVVP